MCVEEEHSSQQSHFLQDDTEAVNVSFLGPTGGGALCPQQLWGRPQLPCRRRGGGAQEETIHHSAHLSGLLLFKLVIMFNNSINHL